MSAKYSANCNCSNQLQSAACYATRPRGGYRFRAKEFIVPAGVVVGCGGSRGSQAGGWPAQPLDPAGPGPGPHDIRPERGSSRPAETGCRRRRNATRRRWSRRCSSRLVLVTATSASTGAIMSAAAASARGRTAGRRPGAGAGDQVTVTDSHHPALWMAPAASSRRQCPLDSCTCRGQSPWLPRDTE